MITLAEARRLCPELVAHERALEQRVLEQQARIDWLLRQAWGALSEKRAIDLLSISDQLWLGLELMPPTVEPPTRSVSVREYERRQRKKKTEPAVHDSQLHFGPDVEIQVIENEDSEIFNVPESQRELVSENVVYRLAQRSPYVVLKHVTKTWKLTESGKLVTPAAPHSVVPGSSADVSFLAGMLIDKFQFHLPLYRQHARLEQHGVFLDRGTLTRQVHRSLELLEPIFHCLSSSVLTSPVLGVDESPTPAALQKGQGREKGKMKQGYFWAFYGSNDEVFFHFSPSRSGKVLKALLGNYQGVLLSDGYIVYESYASGQPGVLHAQCWSHSRRNFVHIEKSYPELCRNVLMIFQQLYALERQAELGSEELRELRDKKSRPLVETLFNYLRKQVDESIFMPNNPFLKAAQYMLDRREALWVFLDRPEVPIDTNHLEREIRPSVVGRKNWLFNFTEAGARYAAIAYSLIQSCILARVDPMVYLVDVLQRIDTHPTADVHLLTPRLWARNFAQSPLRSAAHRGLDYASSLNA